MRKVITYGTYDLLHYGHINLLRRAKELGDYLIVGVTTDNFDKARGKLLVQQSLEERIAAVKATGFADEVILEEYEGQKIDDIKKYGVDIFTVGSDWVGKFDYLSEYCDVVYLPRTEGISSTELRNRSASVRLGIAGMGTALNRFLEESKYVSGIEIPEFYLEREMDEYNSVLLEAHKCASFDELLENVDAVYIIMPPAERADYIEKALNSGKHVLSEAPMALDGAGVEKLYELAKEKNVVLCMALKTAYSLAFQRMIVLLKSGVIGTVKGMEATCTSLDVRSYWDDDPISGGSFVGWGPSVVLAAMKVLGRDFREAQFISDIDDKYKVDSYTKLQLIYDNAEATLKVGNGIKAEGDMVIYGTGGYIYVPSPWWKMDYFEVRKEDSRYNKRYFYPFEGEGMRYELAEFIKTIRNRDTLPSVSKEECVAISELVKQIKDGHNVKRI